MIKVDGNIINVVKAGSYEQNKIADMISVKIRNKNRMVIIWYHKAI